MNHPVLYADYDGKKVEVTIYTKTYIYVLSSGTLTVTYSLRRELPDNSDIRVVYEPQSLEYEFPGSPLNIALTKKVADFETELSLTVAEIKNGNSSTSFSLSPSGAKMTIRRDITDGYYEEISYTYLPNRHNSLPPLPENKDSNTVKIRRLLTIGCLLFAMGGGPDCIIPQQLPLKQ